MILPRISISWLEFPLSNSNEDISDSTTGFPTTRTRDNGTLRVILPESITTLSPSISLTILQLRFPEA